MAIQIQIKKKDLFLISAIMIFLIGVSYVIAFGGSQPIVMGHTPGEMEWSQPIPSDLSVNGSIRIIPRSSSTCDVNKEGAMYYDGDNNQVYICRNGAWSNYQGATGLQGPQGPQGIQGLVGPVGPSAICYYKNIAYSTGARCNPTAYCSLVESNKVMRCNADGSWAQISGGYPCPRACSG